MWPLSDFSLCLKVAYEFPDRPLQVAPHVRKAAHANSAASTTAAIVGLAVGAVGTAQPASEISKSDREQQIENEGTSDLGGKKRSMH